MERSNPLVKHAEWFGAMAFAVKYPQEAPPEIVAMGHAIIVAWHRGYKDAQFSEWHEEKSGRRYPLKDRV